MAANLCVEKQTMRKEDDNVKKTSRRQRPENVRRTRAGKVLLKNTFFNFHFNVK